MQNVLNITSSPQPQVKAREERVCSSTDPEERLAAAKEESRGWQVRGGDCSGKRGSGGHYERCASGRRGRPL